MSESTLELEIQQHFDPFRLTQGIDVHDIQTFEQYFKMLFEAFAALKGKVMSGELPNRESLRLAYAKISSLPSPTSQVFSRILDSMATNEDLRRAIDSARSSVEWEASECTCLGVGISLRPYGGSQFGKGDFHNDYSPSLHVLGPVRALIRWQSPEFPPSSLEICYYIGTPEVAGPRGQEALLISQVDFDPSIVSRILSIEVPFESASTDKLRCSHSEHQW